MCGVDTEGRDSQPGLGMAMLLTILAATLLSLVLFTTAHAGDLQAGIEAFDQRDFAVALREFRPLANQGNPRAQFFLGFMYDFGKGVPEDEIRAYAWYSIAAARGNELVDVQKAEHNKKLIAESMTREQRARAQALAPQYWETYSGFRLHVWPVHSNSTA